MKTFTVEEISKMAADLTIKHPQALDKIHNMALIKLLERATLLADKERLESELADNNVIDINKNKRRGGQ